MIPGQGSAQSPTWLKNQSPKQAPWCQDPVGPFHQAQKLDHNWKDWDSAQVHSQHQKLNSESGMSLFQGSSEDQCPLGAFRGQPIQPRLCMNSCV